MARIARVWVAKRAQTIGFLDLKRSRLHNISVDIPKAIQEIQYMLAPAIMVSSASLLLLGFQTKFSNLASRFRVLNREKQELGQKAGRSREEEARLANVRDQVQYLLRRASLVKNAILLTYGAILFLVGTSVLILMDIYSSREFHYLILGAFSAGLVCLFLTALVMIMETGLFYRIMIFEKKSWTT